MPPRQTRAVEDARRAAAQQLRAHPAIPAHSHSHSNIPPFGCDSLLRAENLRYGRNGPLHRFPRVGFNLVGLSADAAFVRGAS